MQGIIRNAVAKAARLGALLVAANLALGCAGGIGGLFRDEDEAAFLQEKVVTGPPVEIQVRVNIGVVAFRSVVSWN